MEEVNLRGIKSCRSSWYSVINWWDNSNTSFSWKFVSFDFVFEFKDWSIRENHSDFVFKNRNQSLKSINSTSKLFFEIFEFFLFDSLSSHVDDFLGQSILVDDEMRIIWSEKFTDLLDLVWTNISKISEDDLFVGSKHLIEFLNC